MRATLKRSRQFSDQIGSFPSRHGLVVRYIEVDIFAPLSDARHGPFALVDFPKEDGKRNSLTKQCQIQLVQRPESLNLS